MTVLPPKSSRRSRLRRASAGGQLEQPWDVNSSSTTVRERPPAAFRSKLRASPAQLEMESAPASDRMTNTCFIDCSMPPRARRFRSRRHVQPDLRVGELRLVRIDRAHGVLNAAAGGGGQCAVGHLAMGTGAAGLAGAEDGLREGRWFVELDDDLFHRDVGAAEVTEIPFDAFAGTHGDFHRVGDDVEAAGALLDIDAYRNRAHGGVIDV